MYWSKILHLVIYLTLTFLNFFFSAGVAGVLGVLNCKGEHTGELQLSKSFALEGVFGCSGILWSIKLDSASSASSTVLMSRKKLGLSCFKTSQIFTWWFKEFQIYEHFAFHEWERGFRSRVCCPMVSLFCLKMIPQK